MITFDPYGNEIDFAINCVKQACNLTRRIEETMVSSSLEKEDRSPVTVADFSVQALVGHAISESFPDFPLVAEESTRSLRTDRGEAILKQASEYLSEYRSGAGPNEILQWIEHGQGHPGERFWILDPVDGTKGFLRGGQYAVALALAEQGQIQIGVLGCPHLDLDASDGSRSRKTSGSIAVAVRGKGAWVGSLVEESFRPLTVSACANPQEARLLRSYESGHTNVEQMSAFSEALKMRQEPLRLDSQAKYLMLAAAKGDLMLRLLSPTTPSYKEKIWDQAAGSIVVEEAGGQISDLSGSSLDFTTGKLLTNNRGILASNGRLHATALAALGEIGV